MVGTVRVELTCASQQVLFDELHERRAVVQQLRQIKLVGWVLKSSQDLVEVLDTPLHDYTIVAHGAHEFHNVEGNGTERHVPRPAVVLVGLHLLEDGLHLLLLCRNKIIYVDVALQLSNLLARQPFNDALKLARPLLQPLDNLSQS